ncbi:hypothetical protein PoB_003912200 [Plakobranchus ocellatus]|uniref:Uncharacterized protein n=1 Tax=Plakobranchus ocellatus TaxID=259542 RepID=A0AAV4B0G3_9GAST|nr:hypothetical protein PoB_003912200 [Plakobranchus ocellatus]
MLLGLYTATRWSAFIAWHNNHPYSVAYTLPTYSLPSLPAATTIRAPWPLLCQLIDSLHCLPHHPPCSLVSTMPNFSQYSLSATTTIHAPWPLLCQLIVSLHCLHQPPSMLSGLYSANL